MALLNRTACLLAIILLYAQPIQAAEGLKLNEQEIKAGLLYNFLKYTDWPVTGFSQPNFITVCVFGEDPFDGYLKRMEGRTVNQRDITLKQLREINETHECQLLFVNAKEKKNWPKLRQSLSGKNVLTVSDLPSFATEGGMIEFIRQDNHINAHLNIEAASAAGLQVEDRLLRLVTVVRPAGGR